MGNITGLTYTIETPGGPQQVRGVSPEMTQEELYLHEQNNEEIQEIQGKLNKLAMVAQRINSDFDKIIAFENDPLGTQLPQDVGVNYTNIPILDDSGVPLEGVNGLLVYPSDAASHPAAKAQWLGFAKSQIQNRFDNVAETQAELLAEKAKRLANVENEFANFAREINESDEMLSKIEEINTRSEELMREAEAMLNSEEYALYRKLNLPLYIENASGFENRPDLLAAYLSQQGERVNYGPFSSGHTYEIEGFDVQTGQVRNIPMHEYQNFMEKLESIKDKMDAINREFPGAYRKYLKLQTGHAVKTSEEFWADVGRELVWFIAVEVGVRAVIIIGTGGLAAIPMVFMSAARVAARSAKVGAAALKGANKAATLKTIAGASVVAGREAVSLFFAILLPEVQLMIDAAFFAYWASRATLRALAANGENMVQYFKRLVSRRCKAGVCVL